MNGTTTVRGSCGHDWVDFPSYARDGLHAVERRTVEAKISTCDTCLAGLGDTITISALIYKLMDGSRLQEQGTRRN